MSLAMDEQEFTTKYGFSLHDLYYSCVKDIERKTYWSCTISEVAFGIADKIYNELNEDNMNCEGILYKYNMHKYSNVIVHDYDVAIPYKDLYFKFTIGWVGNSISVKDWDIFVNNEIEKNEQYTDIYELVAEEEDYLCE